VGFLGHEFLVVTIGSTRQDISIDIAYSLQEGSP
jgi:hypothetical protein